MINGDDKNLYLFVAQRIRLARQKAGLTQEELGETLGLSRVSIVNIEKGNQRVLIHYLYLIAMATNVDIPYFMPSILGEELMSLPQAVVTSKQKEDFFRSIADVRKALTKALDQLDKLEQ